ncbi:MAG: YbaK/EbsC family protein [Patescibacteria group bacterium]
MSTDFSKYHPTVSKIAELLTEHGAWYETFEHEPVRTSEEAAKVRDGYTLSQGAKAIIVKTRKPINQEINKSTNQEAQISNNQENNSSSVILNGTKDPVKQIMFVMLVMSADKKFDSKKAKRAVGVKDMSFATPEEVAEITGGVLVGGVPPFGNIFGIDVYADPSICTNEKIIFNAGDRSFSIGMKSEDYMRIVKPKAVEIIQV